MKFSCFFCIMLTGWLSHKDHCRFHGKDGGA